MACAVWAKRIALGLEVTYSWCCTHWSQADCLDRSKARLPGKIDACRARFRQRHAGLHRSCTKRRASIHLIQGNVRYTHWHAGGMEVLGSELPAFSQRLKAESHTLKRALTDPHIFSSIGNAYSDEILHRARLSPIALTRTLDDEAISRLFDAVDAILSEWTDRLRKEAGGGFPEKVSAFREGMAVHGRYGRPARFVVQCKRIVYADNETNYCARCQTAVESSPIGPAFAAAQEGLAAVAGRN